MIITGYKFEIQNLIRIINRYPGCIPYDWNPKSQTLSVSKNRFRCLCYKLILVVCTFVTFLMWLRLCSKSYNDLFMSILSLTIATGNISCVLCRWNWNLNSKYVHALNQMITFETNMERWGYFSSKSNLKN